jgi:sulfur-oxidizing protein SoxA
MTVRRCLGFIAACLCVAATGLSATEIPPDQRRSGYADAGPDTKAMQDDDTANPGMLWVLDGEAAWNAKAGAANRACADCHQDATESMKGVAARYPAYDATRSRPIDLEERVNICRTEHQNATPLRFESRELLALTAYVGRQSRGMPIAPASDPRLAPFVAAGRALFEQRQGQINMSCAQCHDDNWGKRLAGNIVPQGQPTGYPIYRLEWQNLGSLQRRLRNCISGMRAELYEWGSPELVALELFLMRRAGGLAVETPGVRP